MIVPTLGRPAQLEACLTALAACEPRASEVLVVDQSGGDEIRALTRRFAEAGARYLYCDGTGKPRGANVGLREARHDNVLLTDDDCGPATSWVRVTVKLLEQGPPAIVTGRVLAPDGSGYVPSTIDDVNPRVFRAPHISAISGNNMAFNRVAVLAIGGFDERFTLAADDNDLSYRWLRAGGQIRYEPQMVVWHHDWRTLDEIDRLHVRYMNFQGLFYAKHLRAGDLGVLPFLVRDFRDGVVGLRDQYVRGRPRGSDWRQGVLRGLPAGLMAGWRG